MKIYIQYNNSDGTKFRSEVFDVDYTKSYRFVSCKKNEIVLEEAEPKVISRNVEFGRLTY